MSVLTLCDVCGLDKASEAEHHLLLSHHGANTKVRIDLCKIHFNKFCQQLPRIAVEQLKTQQITRDKEKLQ